MFYFYVPVDSLQNEFHLEILKMIKKRQSRQKLKLTYDFSQFCLLSCLVIIQHYLF